MIVDESRGWGPLSETVGRSAILEAIMFCTGTVVSPVDSPRVVDREGSGLGMVCSPEGVGY